MKRKCLNWTVAGLGITIGVFSGCVHQGGSASESALNMLGSVVSTWTEVSPNAQTYTRAEALRTVQSMDGRFIDGNTGSPYAVWQAGDASLSLEIRGSRTVRTPEIGAGAAPVVANPTVGAAAVGGLKGPVIQFSTPKINPTESVETNKFVLSAELPYKAIRGMSLHMAPGTNGQGALIVDVDGGGWILFIANSAADAHLLHAALETLRQG